MLEMFLKYYLDLSCLEHLILYFRFKQLINSIGNHLFVISTNCCIIAHLFVHNELWKTSSQVYSNAPYNYNFSCLINGLHFIHLILYVSSLPFILFIVYCTFIQYTSTQVSVRNSFLGIVLYLTYVISRLINVCTKIQKYKIMTKHSVLNC